MRFGGVEAWVYGISICLKGGVRPSRKSTAAFRFFMAFTHGRGMRKAFVCAGRFFHLEFFGSILDIPYYLTRDTRRDSATS
jgi:hypothetical protein